VKNKTILIGVLTLLIFAVSATSADNTIHLAPKDSNVPDGYCNEKTVELMLNTDDLVASWDAHISFDTSCVNITDVSFTGSEFTDAQDYSHKGDHIWIGADAPSGTTIKGDALLLAHITIHCNCSECAYCESPLEFTYVGLYDDSGSDVSVVGDDGTFTCGAGAQPCLGTCCNDSECTDPFAENIPCKDCIEAGKYWHPNKDTACFNDVENPPDLYLTSCPECCDGVDNADTDTDVDYPADKQCPCGLSPSEDTGGPPIPELPTLALAGIGILGAILLARKRE